MVPKQRRYLYVTLAGSLSTIIILMVMGIIGIVISQVSEPCGILQGWEFIVGISQIIFAIILSIFLITYQCMKDDRMYFLVQLLLGFTVCIQFSISIFGSILLFDKNFMCSTKLIWAISMGSVGSIWTLLIFLIIYAIMDFVKN